jgi:hypothetical protein
MTRLAVGGNVGTLTLAPHENVLGRERVDRLAYRALADAEALGQLELARNRLAGLPGTAIQPPDDQVLDLPVERQERWGGTAHDR